MKVPEEPGTLVLVRKKGPYSSATFGGYYGFGAKKGPYSSATFGGYYGFGAKKRSL